MKVIYGFIFALSLFIIFIQDSLSGELNVKRNYSLKEDFAISDKNTEDFYLKYPTQICVDSNGNIYIRENYSTRVLKFDNNGKFIRVLAKSGKGPGEVNSVANIYVNNNSIYIFNKDPAKVVIFDESGNFKKEFRISKNIKAKLATVYNNDYFLFKFDLFKDYSKGSKYIFADQVLYKTNASGEVISKKFKFPIKMYFVNESLGMGFFNIGRLNFSSLKGRCLFVSHTPEYKIKIIDLKNNKIRGKISKNYKRVKIPKELAEEFNTEMVILGDKVFKRPDQEYFCDIQKLLVYKNFIWVVTSTVKNQLF